MRRGRLVEVALLALLVVGVAAHLLVQDDPARRTWRFMPGMVDTPAYASQEANPVFADGMTLRAPPEGSVPRSLPPLVHDGRPLDLETPWAKLDNTARAHWDGYAPPVAFASLEEAEQKAWLARGREVYDNVCVTCHDPGGTGKAPVTRRGVPPPPSLLAQGARDLSDGRMFRIITAGRDNMAAHANQVLREDRWKVIAWIRRLQEQAEEAAAAEAPEAPAAPEDGESEGAG